MNRVHCAQSHSAFLVTERKCGRPAGRVACQRSTQLQRTIEGYGSGKSPPKKSHSDGHRSIRDRRLCPGTTLIAELSRAATSRHGQRLGAYAGCGPAWLDAHGASTSEWLVRRTRYGGTRPAMNETL